MKLRVPLSPENRAYLIVRLGGISIGMKTVISSYDERKVDSLETFACDSTTHPELSKKVNITLDDLFVKRLAQLISHINANSERKVDYLVSHFRTQGF